MEKTKFNLMLSPGAKDQLTSIQKRTQATSFAEVFRKALAIYDAVVMQESDWEVVLRNKRDKTEKILVIPR
jgi:hypothetical protein